MLRKACELYKCEASTVLSWRWDTLPYIVWECAWRHITILGSWPKHSFVASFHEQGCLHSPWQHDIIFAILHVDWCHLNKIISTHSLDSFKYVYFINLFNISCNVFWFCGLAALYIMTCHLQSSLNKSMKITSLEPRVLKSCTLCANRSSLLQACKLSSQSSCCCCCCIWVFDLMFHPLILYLTTNFNN